MVHIESHASLEQAKVANWSVLLLLSNSGQETCNVLMFALINVWK
jgi:hypothetical protein